jgi:pimeloyl-ACP methyl ester carboxylesterase
MLFPPAAARHTRELIADARLIIIKGAGHAPFISHPDVFLSALESIAANHG